VRNDNFLEIQMCLSGISVTIALPILAVTSDYILPYSSAILPRYYNFIHFHSEWFNAVYISLGDLCLSFMYIEAHVWCDGGLQFNVQQSCI